MKRHAGHGIGGRVFHGVKMRGMLWVDESPPGERNVVVGGNLPVFREEILVVMVV